MSILRAAPSFATGATGLAGGYAVITYDAPAEVAEAVSFLEMIVWTTTIEGQLVQVTGQGLLGIISALIGVLGLAVSIIRLFKK